VPSQGSFCELRCDSETACEAPPIEVVGVVRVVLGGPEPRVGVMIHGVVALCGVARPWQISLVAHSLRLLSRTLVQGV